MTKDKTAAEEDKAAMEEVAIGILTVNTGTSQRKAKMTTKTILTVTNTIRKVAFPKQEAIQLTYAASTVADGATRSLIA